MSLPQHAPSVPKVLLLLCMGSYPGLYHSFNLRHFLKIHFTLKERNFLQAKWGSLVVVWSPSLIQLFRPHGLQPARLLCPWDSAGKNTGVSCHSLLQGIFPTQEMNPGLLHCRQILYRLSYKGSPTLSQGLQNICYTLGGRLAPHSSTLAWKIPWTEEPGGLQSMGSRRVRHN